MREQASNNLREALNSLVSLYDRSTAMENFSEAWINAIERAKDVLAEAQSSPRAGSEALTVEEVHFLLELVYEEDGIQFAGPKWTAALTKRLNTLLEQKLAAATAPASAVTLDIPERVHEIYRRLFGHSQYDKTEYPALKAAVEMALREGAAATAERTPAKADYTEELLAIDGLIPRKPGDCRGVYARVLEALGVDGPHSVVMADRQPPVERTASDQRTIHDPRGAVPCSTNSAYQPPTPDSVQHATLPGAELYCKGMRSSPAQPLPKVK